MSNIQEKINDVLRDVDGYLLSSFEEYKNAKSKLTWRCRYGHVFQANWNHVQQRKWCPYCAGKYITIEYIQKIAEQKGGKCLSKAYGKCVDKLLWECRLGHRWEASLNRVKNQHAWCPYCAGSVGEKICRKCFEFIFKEKFPKTKPAWLMNEKGFRLELDGFCESLNIAFEYNGPHHYNDNCYKHAELNHIAANDKIKSAECDRRGIKLIVIPENVTLCSKLDYIKKYIKKALTELEIDVPPEFDNFDILDCELYDYNPLTELQKIAADLGGKCLSDKYEGTKVKLKWKCEFGHVWSAMPMTIKNDVWCPICREPNKMTDKDLVIYLLKMKDAEKNVFNKRLLLRAAERIKNGLSTSCSSINRDKAKRFEHR